jgi:hypothetical protein
MIVFPAYISWKASEFVRGLIPSRGLVGTIVFYAVITVLTLPFLYLVIEFSVFFVWVNEKLIWYANLVARTPWTIVFAPVIYYAIELLLGILVRPWDLLYNDTPYHSSSSSSSSSSRSSRTSEPYVPIRDFWGDRNTQYRGTLNQ